jgi:hypothetical protein
MPFGSSILEIIDTPSAENAPIWRVFRKKFYCQSKDFTFCSETFAWSVPSIRVAAGFFGASESGKRIQQEPRGGSRGARDTLLSGR